MDKNGLHKVMEDYGAKRGECTYYAGVGDAIEFVCALLEADTRHKRAVLGGEEFDEKKWSRLTPDIMQNMTARARLVGLQLEIGALISPAHL